MASDSTTKSWIRPALDVPGVGLVSSTRFGGVSQGQFAGLNLGDHVGDSDECVKQNRQLLGEALPEGQTVTWLSQVHGSRVIHAPSEFEVGIEADAVWSDVPGYACAIMTADCLPIILVDKDGVCIAAVHGGWRGLADQILRKAVEALPVSASSLIAWLGPAIGPSAFEVGTDVLSAFCLSENDAAVRRVVDAKNKYLLDLNELAARQLRELGVPADQIFGGDMCTYASPERFYSYRRDGETGRMATLVYFDTHQG